MKTPNLNFEWEHCVVSSRIRYIRMVRDLREGVTQSFIQVKLTFIPATLSRNAGKIVLLD